MHYELWALNTGNLIRDFDHEIEALQLVRDLLADGWDAADLGMHLEWDEGEDGDDSLLPPAVTGPELAAQAAEPSVRIEHQPTVNGDSTSLSRTRELR
jgi:hypothetical protein